MSSDEYPIPVAISQLGESDSREAQNSRAIDWLLTQPGGSIIVVTPRKDFDDARLKRLIARPNVRHLTWKGFSAGSLANHRVIHAWPNRKQLNDLWGVEADALVVIEWGEAETATWVEDARPVRLLPGQTMQPEVGPAPVSEPLPNGIEEFLEHIARWAAGYDSGLKWNEEDKIKADMMNRPERWSSVTVEEVRAKCRELKMRPEDVETITGFLERRKQGRRFNVRSSYRTYTFG